jgi:potassium efflux system protein
VSIHSFMARLSHHGAPASLPAMPIFRVTSALRSLPLVLVLLVAAPVLSAQGEGNDAAQLEALRAVVAGDPALDETQRSAAGALLDAAASDMAGAQQRQAQAAELRAQAQAAPQQMRELERALAIPRDRDLQQWLRGIPRDADSETLERLLARETEAITAVFAEMEQAAAELAESQTRSAQGSGLATALRQELDQAPAGTVAGEPSSLAQARQLAAQARRRLREAELTLQQATQETASTQQALLELRVRELRHRLLRLAPRLDLLKDRLARRSRAELATRSAEIAAQALALEPEGGARAELARANAQTAGELVENNDALVAERDELSEFGTQRAQVRQSLRDTRTRLELGGDSETLGLLLRSERTRLTSPARLEARLDAVRQMLTQARLRLSTIAEAQRESGDQDSTLAAVRAEQDIAADDDATTGAAADGVGPLLRQRIELLGQLENLVRRRVATLERLESVLAELLADTRTLAQLLDERLLWIRSHRAVNTGWLASLGAGAYDLVKPARLRTTAELLWLAVKERPAEPVAMTLLVLALFVLRGRARGVLARLAEPVRSVRTDSYWHTARAFAWTLLAALPWTIAALMAGLLLQDIGETGKYSDSLGRALVAAASAVFLLDLLRWLNVERGLAHAHFRWTRARRETLLRWLRRLAIVILPAQFVITLAFVRNQDLAIATQARVAIVVLCAALAWAAWRMLAPGALMTARGVSTEPSRVRRTLRLLASGGFAAIALLALAGYVYSAGTLVEACGRLLALLVALALLHGMIARWFLLGERRLAMIRAEQKRTAAQADAATAGDGESVPEAREEPVALETISVHTQRLLRALTLSLLVIGLLWAGSAVLPALAYLNEIELWRYADPANTETGTGAVTLFTLLAGMAVLALTVVATRNLPGLIELGLLSRINVDAASRYAITSIARYAIVIFGVITGLGLLGLRWSQLQWMAAALTVGLGFGLQEIFANFVSGLILLFERPFRIGDQITIGEFTGTVTRIRTRATTLMDGDGREVVVPNKAFITGQLINWTLSDTVTHVGLPVSVAPGTDAALVHRLLLQAARENTRVLAEPVPGSWFKGFADGALNFELRVSVGSLGDRGAVLNELGERVAQLFAKHEVALASPRMDLRVRELPAATVARGSDWAPSAGIAPAPAGP